MQWKETRVGASSPQTIANIAPANQRGGGLMLLHMKWGGERGLAELMLMSLGSPRGRDYLSVLCYFVSNRYYVIQ